MIAEKLSQLLLVPRNVMFFDQGEKIRWRIPRKGRFREMRILREEVLRPAMQVGKVAAPSTGDEDFFARPFCPFQNGNVPSPSAGFNGAHQSGRAAANNECIEAMDHGWLLVRYM